MSGYIDWLFFILINFSGDTKITAEKMNAVLKRAAPKIEPNGINTVESDALFPATMAVSTSGAPLAKAKNVAPAKVGDISSNILFITK
jgi:hypothetical protein